MIVTSPFTDNHRKTAFAIFAQTLLIRRILAVIISLTSVET